MSDQRTNRLPLDFETSQDGLYQQIVLLSARACDWAESMFDGSLNVLLWLRERGDFPDGIPYRVDQRRVERGIWRLTLVADDQLPAGATAAARDEVLKALLASSALQLPLFAVDQVVQCGLFGEVIH